MTNGGGVEYHYIRIVGMGDERGYELADVNTNMDLLYIKST